MRLLRHTSRSPPSAQFYNTSVVPVHIVGLGPSSCVALPSDDGRSPQAAASHLTTGSLPLYFEQRQGGVRSSGRANSVTAGPATMHERRRGGPQTVRKSYFSPGTVSSTKVRHGRPKEAEPARMFIVRKGCSTVHAARASSRVFAG